MQRQETAAFVIVLITGVVILLLAVLIGGGIRDFLIALGTTLAAVPLTASCSACSRPTCSTCCVRRSHTGGVSSTRLPSGCG